MQGRAVYEKLMCKCKIVCYSSVREHVKIIPERRYSVITLGFDVRRGNVMMSVYKLTHKYENTG